MPLSERVYKFYCENFDQLSNKQQFHFASRLFSWRRDAFSERQLSHLYSSFAANGDRDKLIGVLKETLDSNPTSKDHINARELRLPLLSHYKSLWPLHLALFKVSHWYNYFDIDLRDDFLKLTGKNNLIDLRHRLLSDGSATAILSTYSVNYIYLLTKFILKDDKSINPDLFLSLERCYDFSNKDHLQLYIYLLTHCIIGETLFYQRSIPLKSIPIYSKMIQALEKLINQYYDSLHLDSKFEFLVCSKIVGVSSNLKNKIMLEAESSISDKGTFLVDRHNSNPQTQRTDLDNSEHRNVLFIMANSDFMPIQSI